MSLKQRVNADLIQAMKEKDNIKKGVLQLVKAGFNNAEKLAKKELDNSQLLSVVQKELKEVKQSLDEAYKAQRTDIVAQEIIKLEVLSVYMPKQLDEVEIKCLLIGAGIKSGTPIGEAMKVASQVITKGTADMKLVSIIVKELIQ